MRIRVGSKNASKVAAVEELVEKYPLLQNAQVSGHDVPSGVSSHPLSLNETVQGAVNRARNAFQDCELSVGLEGGMVPVPHTRSGYMEFNACAIFDGEKIYVGLSSGFEFPPKVTELILQGIEGSKAMIEAGITSDPHIGSGIGAIGLLSKGRLNRMQYVQQSIASALIQLENKEWFA